MVRFRASSDSIFLRMAFQNGEGDQSHGVRKRRRRRCDVAVFQMGDLCDVPRPSWTAYAGNRHFGKGKGKGKTLRRDLKDFEEGAMLLSQLELHRNCWCGDEEKEQEYETFQQTREFGLAIL
jgi:hypothetical protein